MNVLIYSRAFAPQIGGVETYVMHLARGLAARDSGKVVRVTLVTQSLQKDFHDAPMPFAIVRNPVPVWERRRSRGNPAVFTRRSRKACGDGASRAV